MKVTFSHKGDFKHLEKFLNNVSSGKYYARILRKYAEEGVSLLAAATPRDTGITADSWGYEVVENSRGIEIVWTNSSHTRNKQELSIILLLQYGHATRGGTWIAPNDFITPAMQPLFDKLADAAWQEVISK